MKAGIICFTEHGVLLAEQLVNGLAAHGILCEAWLKKKEYRSALPVEVAFLEGTLPEWTAEQFRSKDLLIFIGSTGIAVRSIAPYVQSKKTDPAVIVVDEQGRHAISLLSGHIGGANELTLLVAELTGENLQWTHLRRGEICIWIPCLQRRKLQQHWWII